MLRQSVDRCLNFAENAVCGFDTVVANVSPNLVEILFRRGVRRNRFICRETLSTAPVPNPGEGFRSVHELPLIRLFYASGNLFPQRI